ncbi:MAG: hypothetical protein AAFY11_04165 [Cyanobacteria bacterium J06641_5]
MKRLLQTASVSLLALLVGVGCGGSSESPEDLTTEPTPTVESAEVPAPEEQEVSQFTGPIFVAGLTPPTDAKDILARTGDEPGRSRGVDDPFAIIPVAATGSILEPEVTVEPAEVVEPAVEPAPVVTEVEEVSPPTVEPEPVPNNAEAVRVTGVVRIGNTVRAIIESPNEPTSRHVRAGQLIAGTVLVKGIDINGPTPTVILEENGIEVVKPIGEAIETSSSFIAASPKNAAAVLPPPPPISIFQ